MMIKEQLFELAFEYKKTKLWTKLAEDELFAVKLADGTIGYVCIMGVIGQHLALSLYVGEEGFQSYRVIAESDPMDNLAKLHRNMIGQNCIQCSFERKDDLTKEEQEAAKQYAKAHKIRLSGANAYPQFSTYKPEFIPVTIKSEQEQQYLCEALRAAITVSKLLDKKIPSALGIYGLQQSDDTLPMMEFNGEEYAFSSRIECPKNNTVNDPTPIINNDVMIAKMKKITVDGTLACNVINLPNPVQDDPEETPYFPATLLAVELESGLVLPIPPVKSWRMDAQQLVTLFLDTLIRVNMYPREIKVQNELTYSILSDFCKKLDITLSFKNSIEMLEEVEEGLFEFGYEEDEDDLDDMINDEDMMFEMLDMMLDMERSNPGSVPKDIMKEMKLLNKEGMLPLELERKLHSVSSKKTNIRVVSNQSFVISVSLGTGCYRHIQIGENATLEQFSLAILEAFSFDNDHAHVFFMDNRMWSREEAYFMEGMGDGDQTTSSYCLNDFELYKGMLFKYVFDFGDEWTFQCKVLRAADGDTDVPQVVRRKGEAPEQYCY